MSPIRESRNDMKSSLRRRTERKSWVDKKIATLREKCNDTIIEFSPNKSQYKELAKVQQRFDTDFKKKYWYTAFDKIFLFCL